MASLRLFLAVPVPRAAEEWLGEMLGKVSGNREVKWVSKPQLHVTLRFIGNLEETLVSRLEGLVEEAARGFASFEAEWGGLGAFPHLDRPRVLFIPVVRGVESFQQLEARISSALEGMGLDSEDREYHPHLTLGRVREGRDGRGVIKLLQGFIPSQGAAWRVDRFSLFKSQLTSEGPVYTKLREFQLRR